MAGACPFFFARPSAICSLMKFAAPVLMALALAACSRTDNEPGPGGVTVGEAKALDDAAAMLEERDGKKEGSAAPNNEKQ
jgi:hypothetical protein